MNIRSKSLDILDVFSLVFVRHRDVSTTWFQVDGLGLTKLFVFNGKGLVKDIGDIIVQRPRQILVVLLVHAFHVVDGNLLAQHHLVECSDEERIKEATVEDSQAHHSPDKLEVVEMFWVDARVRVDLESVVVVRRIFEQAVKGIEHFVRKQKEEFTATR